MSAPRSTFSLLVIRELAHVTGSWDPLPWKFHNPDKAIGAVKCGDSLLAS